jgi:YD repeat-containing protein
MRAIQCFARILAFATIFLAPFASADLHPNKDRGFSPGRAYDIGAIDNVNLFNGNLVVTIPIGQTYKVGGDLSYQLTLVNGGNPWSMLRELNGANRDVEEQWPNPRSNAGLGWQVTLGRLIRPDDPFNSHGTQRGWSYLGPDGSEQDLGNDDLGFVIAERGLRRTLSRENNEQVQLLEKSDGTIHTFSHATGMLKSIRDRFGYRVDIEYSSDGRRWTIRDSAGREHAIVFQTDPSDAQRTLIDYIDLQTFGGAAARYDFTYDKVTISRGCVHSTSEGTPITADVALLKELSLPDRDVENPASVGSKYAFTYEKGNASDAACATIPRASSGLLRTVTIPTGGRYEWTWRMYQFPMFPADAQTMRSSPGVAERAMVDLSGQRHVWTYHTDQPDDMVFCDDPKNPADQRCFWPEVVNTVYAPDQSYTVRYFSAYAGGATRRVTGDVPEWNPEEYGLNFTRRTSVGSPARYLSSETFDAQNVPLRREYRLFEGGKAGRLKATRTVFLDDCTDRLVETTCRYQDVMNSGHDGYGRYRQSSTIGNFVPGEKARTSFTNYQGPPPTGEWVLKTYSEQCTALEDAQRTVPISACSELAGAETTKFTFDRTTGFLISKKILAGATEASTDLVSAFTRAVDAANPQVETITESHTGGDDCANQKPCGHFTITNVYRNGTAVSSQYADVTFKSADVTIDSSTGLPASARDVSGKADIDYVHDAMGRMRSTTPRVESAPAPRRSGKLAHTYSSGTTPATVIERRYGDAAGTTLLLERSWTYDGFGRVTKEVSPHPDGPVARTTEYDAFGRVKKVSEAHASNTAPLHFTTTDYDIFGRVLTVTSPDRSTVSTRYTGTRLTERMMRRATAEAAESDTFVCEVRDSFGRLVEVHEGAALATGGLSCGAGAVSVAKYSYDVADRLIAVEMSANGVVQRRTFEYDKRGLLIQETHPERTQATRYSRYNARGQATRKIDGTENGAFDVTFVYDSAERLVEVRETSTSRLLKQFQFHTSNTDSEWRNGKLASASRINVLSNGMSVTVSDSFAYAERDGRVSKKVTVATDSLNRKRTFEQKFAYDVLGNLNEHDYPKCLDCTVSGPERKIVSDYVSGKGFLVSVSDFAKTISYWPNGLMRQIAHSNGVTESQNIDTANGMARPKSFQFGGWTVPPAACPAPALSGPQDVTVPYDGSTQLRVTATAAGGTLKYQWFRGTGAAVTAVGGDAAFLDLTGIRESATYWVRVTNTCGTSAVSTDSRAVTVAVGNAACSAPQVAGPLNLELDYGGSGTLVVDAHGQQGSTMCYQWYRGATGDTRAPVGSNQAFLELRDVREGASYWVRVKSVCGTSATCAATGPTTDSTAAVVSVREASCSTPSVYVPAEVRVAFGDRATITATVEVSQDGTPSYAWFRGVSGDTSNPVGQHTAVLTLESVAASSTYWLRVTNTCVGKTTVTNSQAVAVTIELSRPGRVVATQAANGTVQVEWPAVAGATTYTVARWDSTRTLTLFTADTNSFTDRDTVALRAYIYSVKAHSGSTSSGVGPGDLVVVTRQLFSGLPRKDDPIRGDYLPELRGAIDAIFALVNHAPVWESTAYTSSLTNMPILASDWIEAHEQMTEARKLVNNAHGLPLVDLGNAPAVDQPITPDVVANLLRAVQ